ncbi:Gfo/Idh/MocA family oxidoreductase [Leifsonia sp. F6_8S_P_1B]|uniref:Gfo/Idh/MocA family oxidoreductase n=1 Tax=Leifsonia williamsii TaxID=3035919 RepID=A0ABT8K984_9MICO|nr:Gfo/Idh/MocA family oxidoreductase [Leifsonia williamsii]MDN4614005.1 Gfo/Idh/MocA family oxidoreductase [Leifsonia williamsii]
MSAGAHGAGAGAVAIVGAGRMGRAHAAAWAALGVPVRWAVSPRTRPDLPGAPDARWARTLEEALADPELTIVSLCTPTPSHAALATQALEAGRHVLLEKPIALTVADAEALAAVASRSTGMLMVAHVVRFFPGYAALATRVAAGSVGRPRLVRASRVSAAPRWADWLADEERSGGMLVDFAIHDIDQANLLLGRPVAVTSVGAASVGAPGGAFGTAVATTIEYEDGGVAQLTSAADLPEGEPFRSELEVIGDRGTDRVAAAEGDPFVEQARYVLECIASGAAPDRAPVAAAVDALRVALAARESLRTGGRVEL